MEGHSVLGVRNIHKSFPGVRVLQVVDLTLCEREIRVLVGENGVGKSTLTKVLTEVYEKDEGEIYLPGLDKPTVTELPQDTQNLGISTVYQRTTLCPNLMVTENMYIGQGKSQITNWKKTNGDVKRILDNPGTSVQATQQLSDCSITIQQMAAITRAVDMDCKVLILDESISSLDESEMEKLFGLMRDLKVRGAGVISVTHFLDQVYEVYDRITVLRDDQLVGEYVIEELPRLRLVAKMFGEEPDDVEDIKGEITGYNGNDEYVIEAEGLQGDARIKPFNLHIKKSEVNELTGLLGFGWSECVRALFYVDRVIVGAIRKNGKPTKTTKPLDVMKNGITYLSGDKRRDGIVGDLLVRNNIILAARVLRGLFGPFSKTEANKLTEEYIKPLKIRTVLVDMPIKSLSGGDQQRMILACQLLTHPEYLILDKPTRGIDIGTKVEAQKLVLKLASGGMSLTFISSRTDEMLRTCSRLVVIRDRRVVGELSDGDLTQSRVVETVAGDEML